jgi:hypothetical protein
MNKKGQNIVNCHATRSIDFVGFVLKKSFLLLANTYKTNGGIVNLTVRFALEGENLR